MTAVTEAALGSALMRPALVVLCALALAACGGNGGSGASATGCQEVEAPAPKANGGATKPTVALDPAKSYVLVVETSCGEFEITLDQKASPETAASLVSLSRAGFYDNTIFHRVVPGFVVQGGDPTGSGSGGPGYSTHDRRPLLRSTRGARWRWPRRRRSRRGRRAASSSW